MEFESYQTSPRVRFVLKQSVILSSRSNSEIDTVNQLILLAAELLDRQHKYDRVKNNNKSFAKYVIDNLQKLFMSP